MIAATAMLLLMAAAPQVEAAPPSAAPAAPAPPATPAPHITGGFSAVDQHTPELHKALRAAVAAITPARHPGARLLSAHRQVVAGTNYRMKIKLRDGSRWQAVVWHRLDGQFQVTEAIRLD